MTNDAVLSKYALPTTHGRTAMSDFRRPLKDEDDDLLLRTTEHGHTELYHRPCGKEWLQRAGTGTPNYCPECGADLIEQDSDE